MNTNSSINFILKNLWINISPTKRKRLFVIFVFSILVSLFEVITIGSIIPYFGVLTNPDLIFNHELTKPFIKLLDLKFSYQLLFPITLFFCFVITLATISRIFLIIIQTRTGHHIGADFGKRIYENALYKSYDKFLLINSSIVVSGISQKTTNAVYNVIFPILNFFSSLIILFAILLILFFINFKITVAILLLFILIYSFTLILTKNKMKSYSLIADIETNLVVKKVQEGLGSIRDILLGNFQSQYIKNFQSSDLKLRRALGSVQILSYSPKFIVELIFIFLICLIAYNLAIKPEGISKHLAVLVTYVVAGQRMLPHCQNIYSSLSLIKSGKKTMLSVLELISEENNKILFSQNSKILSFQKEIFFKNVFFSYDKKLVINNLNLSVKKGSKIGIIGKTGNGKSTFLDLLMGLLTPITGQILIDNKVLIKENLLSWQKNISHVPQNIFLSDTSIAENIAFGISNQNINIELVKKASKIANIDLLINSWPKKYQTIVGEKGMQISGGERQRIGIARAIYRESSILVLDEATNALDEETEMEIVNSIFKINPDLTIFIVSHNREILKNCTKIIEFCNGNIK